MRISSKDKVCKILIAALFMLVWGISTDAVAKSDSQVCLFSSEGYTGDAYCTKSSVGFIPLRINTASIKIPNGYSVTLYRFPFYLGGKFELSKSDPDLKLLYGNVRSLRINENPASKGSIIPAIFILLSDDIDPNDWDGDGFDNELEEEYGTDPRDPDSTPPDLDGDKIPDDVDDDRDGDGVSNIIELDRNTDPDDKSDYPDLVPPLLIVYNPPTVKTTDSTIIIFGTVEDTVQPYYGIKELSVTSDQYIGSKFSGQINNQTREFSIEIPLKIDRNELKVVATDHSDNSAETLIVVTHNTAPVIETLIPTNETIVTEEFVTITGSIRTTLPPDEFKFLVNDSQVVVSRDSQADHYSFQFENLPLTVGANRFDFVISSDFGNENRTLTIHYHPNIDEETNPPEISSVSPSNGTIVNTESFNVVAQVESFAGPVSVTFNDESLIASSEGRTRFTLNEPLSFDQNQTSLRAVIVATDSLGNITEQVLNYHLDSSAPVLTIDQTFQPFPSTNMVDGPVVTFSGAVNDHNLAGLMLNDHSVSMQPGASSGTYLFSVDVPLRDDQPHIASFMAFDRSGNVTTSEYVVVNTESTSIEALLPPDGASFIAYDAPVNVQVVGRLQGNDQSDTVYGYIASSGIESAVPFEITGSLVSGQLVLPSSTAEQTIIIEVRSQGGQRKSTDQNRVSVTLAEEIPLELVRSEPDNGAEFIEPNSPIELYFNKEIDFNLLEVKVRETLHGKTYINEDELGEDFIRSKGYVLRDVNRDLDIVTGSLDAIPGSSGAVFSADRYFGYGAEVFIEVTYQSNQLARFRFNVRELPTFINGSIVDQFGQPVEGVEVWLPELDRRAMTNGDGGFAFGYQESGGVDWSAGSYQLLVNSEFGNPAYGSVSSSIHIQPNRVNALPRYTLQQLDRTIPFSAIQSDSVNQLLGGSLTLDLQNGRTLFPDFRTSGAVHVQFLPYEHLGVKTLPNSRPHWLYSIQPRGVQVEGNVKIEMEIPRLRGRLDYIDNSAYRYVVILGYSPVGDVVEPIGVGKIEGNKVISVGKLSLNRLDFIGYAIPTPKINDALSGYESGDLTLQQLKALLVSASSN